MISVPAFDAVGEPMGSYAGISANDSLLLFKLSREDRNDGMEIHIHDFRSSMRI